MCPAGFSRSVVRLNSCRAGFGLVQSLLDRIQFSSDGVEGFDIFCMCDQFTLIFVVSIVVPFDLLVKIALGSRADGRHLRFDLTQIRDDIEI